MNAIGNASLGGGGGHQASMPSASPSMDSMLRDARLINSDIGRHSVKCNFSARLTGRFYQNSSLERHTARKSRLVEMQAKKRRLEKELQLEEQRVKLLEERLHDTERAREDAQELIFNLVRGMVRFQSLVRRKQSMTRFKDIRHVARMAILVAFHLQSRYRGWKGRSRADSIRHDLKQKLMNDSAVSIQASLRRHLQRKYYLGLLSQRNALSDKSAAAIQALLRGKVARKMYLEEMSRRQSAASNVQRVFRGKLGRLEAERIRQLRLKKQSEKPKRVPLHLRRYSTYGSDSVQKKPDKGPKKRDATNRRRSSVDMSILRDGKAFGSSVTNGDPDENDSIATTLTSLTHTTDFSRKRIIRGKMPESTKARTNATSLPSPQKVLASATKQSNHRGRYKSTISSDSTPSDASGRRNNRPQLVKRKDKQTSAQKCSVNKSIHERRRSVPTIASSNIASLTNSPEPRPNTQKRCNESSSRVASRERRRSVPVSSARSNHSSARSSRAEVNKILPRKRNNSGGTASSGRQCQMPRREEISREASLIVEEVLGRAIITHSIATSSFDDDFSEHEDDLE
jgi:hypothetical protein